MKKLLSKFNFVVGGIGFGVLAMYLTTSTVNPYLVYGLVIVSAVNIIMGVILSD